ncbi:hypothetical protein HanXRQr2_Chr13g0594251 [Helianthus annuus]|uniref:Uncharacterized protein n=1 Tax=Helianthus annuus TaxID=4232 RepID=A0A9K3HCF2_HELAN|nr:hypothetical protein HanXRQr2_Chr13g0594251 [Helianthus annuus]
MGFLGFLIWKIIVDREGISDWTQDMSGLLYGGGLFLEWDCSID